MNLINHTLIDVSSGTMLTAHNCVLVPCSALSESEWETLEDASDSDIIEIGRERGTLLANLVTDDVARCVAEALWGEEADKDWNADTLNAIADTIRILRPDLVPDEHK